MPPAGITQKKKLAQKPQMNIFLPQATLPLQTGTLYLQNTSETHY